MINAPQYFYNVTVHNERGEFSFTVALGLDSLDQSVLEEAVKEEVFPLVTDTDKIAYFVVAGTVWNSLTGKKLSIVPRLFVKEKNNG